MGQSLQHTPEDIHICKIQWCCYTHDLTDKYLGTGIHQHLQNKQTNIYDYCSGKVNEPNLVSRRKVAGFINMLWNYGIFGTNKPYTSVVNLDIPVSPVQTNRHLQGFPFTMPTSLVRPTEFRL